MSLLTDLFPDPAAPLPGESELLAGVVANLADDLPKLIYADWLDEQGDPRGTLLREFVNAVRTKPRAEWPETKLFIDRRKKHPKYESWFRMVGIRLWEAIDEYELREHADYINSLARPAIHFKTEQCPDTDCPVGRSKLNGSPDLPPDLPWPGGENPLGFIGQINCEELSGAFASKSLPQTGMLSIFGEGEVIAVDPIYQKMRPSHTNGNRPDCKLVFSPDVSCLQRRQQPAKYTGRFHHRNVTSNILFYHEVLSLPHLEDVSDGFPRLSDDLEELYIDIRSTLGNEGSPHQILGCTLWSVNGHGRDNGIVDPEAYGKGWVNLLTLRCDDYSFQHWGDGDMLQFWIRTDDLSKLDFTQVIITEGGG